MARPDTTPQVRPSVRVDPLAATALGVAAAALVLGLLIAPEERIQGPAQRLMYVHVPAAWTGFLAFATVAVASVAHLLGRGRRSDALAAAAAELGVVMTALAILEGSVWGRVAWGTWWAWDPRLVATALLLVLYVAYLLIRRLPGDPIAVRRRAAVAGVVFFLQVPIVHFSVLWWRTLHQEPTLLQPDVSPPIAPLMLVALITSVVAFTLGGAWYVRRRYDEHLRGPDREEAASPAHRGSGTEARP